MWSNFRKIYMVCVLSINVCRGRGGSMIILKTMFVPTTYSLPMINTCVSVKKENLKNLLSNEKQETL